MRPKKRLGQHFLMDGGTSLRIARLAVPHVGARVAEVGAGTGALTAALVRLEADVTAIEVDSELVSVLRARDDLRAAHIVEADALAFDFDAFGAAEPWIAAGNLPYNIATPLIVRWCTMRTPPERIVAMIQRDVAERLVARPGSPSYGSLTLAVSYRGEVERAFNVGPSQFYPRPNVESAVVVIRIREQPAVPVRDETRFQEVVRGAFAYRRKTLANSLSLALGIPRERTSDALQSLGFDPEIRGEQLDLAAFAALADKLAA